MATLTNQQLQQELIERCSKICQLSMEASSRELVQAFAWYHGHTNTIQAYVHPIRAIYDGETDNPKLAEINIRLSTYEFHRQEEQQAQLLADLERADQYIAYLDLLLAQDKPVTLEDVEGQDYRHGRVCA